MNEKCALCDHRYSEKDSSLCHKCRRARFRDLYRNSKGKLFVIVWGFLRCIPIDKAIEIWPRGTHGAKE